MGLWCVCERERERVKESEMKARKSVCTSKLISVYINVPMYLYVRVGAENFVS